MCKKMVSIPEMLLKKHPEVQFGMVVFLNMMEYQQWQRDRMAKARAAKPRKRFKKRRG